MKKKLILIPLLVLVLIALMGMPVLAWDNEDPCVADNEDFIAGGGQDDGAPEFHSGAQSWPYGKQPNEGYDLYRDDVTDTGNLDSAFILTYTPGEIDLPLIAEYYHPDTGAYWYVGEESPDTYYWALEPRGYDNPKEKDPNRFTVLMSFGRDGAKYVNEDDNTLKSGIDVTGVYDDVGYRLVIPEGCTIEKPSGKRLPVLFLKVVIGATLTFTTGDVVFSEPCILYSTEGEPIYDMWGRITTTEEWVEVGSFTSIVDGKAFTE